VPYQQVHGTAVVPVSVPTLVAATEQVTCKLQRVHHVHCIVHAFCLLVDLALLKAQYHYDGSG
jgi:hypothetical protein